MAQPLPIPPPAAEEPAPHLMRISTQGHLKNYVAFALKFLQENPPRPLTFHTLPPTPTPTQPLASTSKPTKARTNTPHLVPKLISTVEIVKREYLALLALDREAQRLLRRSSSSAKGKGKDVSMTANDDEDGEEEGREEAGEGMRGLWQYNETGCLEDLEGGEEEGGERGERDERREAELALERLKEVLSGKVGPKMVHTPYFKVTLSTIPLPELARRKGITSQHIVTPSRPNRTKSQARRRRKAFAKAAVEGEETEPVVDVDAVEGAAGPGTGLTSEAPAASVGLEKIPTVAVGGGGEGAKKGGKKGKGKRVVPAVAGEGGDVEMGSPAKKRKV